MTKKLNPKDIFELAKSTGRSPTEVIDLAMADGWEIIDTQPHEAQTQAPAQTTGMLNNSTGALELMRQLRHESMAKLYKSDPLVREAMDTQAAIDASRATVTKPSNLVYDEQGRLAGIKSSVVSGVHATSNNQVELMKAIRENISNQYGANN